MLPESQGPSHQHRDHPRPSAGERRLALLWAAAVAAALVLRPFWLLAVDLLPHCRFRALTGLPCPTCGTGHAAVAMLEGQLGEAFTANPLISAAAVAVLAGGLAAPVWVLLAGRRLPRFPERVPRWLLVTAAAAVALNWAYLIATR